MVHDGTALQRANLRITAKGHVQWLKRQQDGAKAGAGPLGALGNQPLINGLRFRLANRPHLGEQRGLAETLFENARAVQQLVRDDRVEHAHAAFVEHAHDGLLLAEAAGGTAAELLIGPRQFE